MVEADAFKETDVIYRALSSSGHHQDMLQTAELVSLLFKYKCMHEDTYRIKSLNLKLLFSLINYISSGIH